MIKKYLSLKEAMTLVMEEKRTNVWAPYQIGALLFHLYQKKQIHSFFLRVRNDWPTRGDYNRTVSELIDSNVIRMKKNIFYTLTGEEPIPGEITCSIDPFSYISHLSAMNFHNLTKKKSKKIFLSSLPLKQWSKKAILLMQNELGEGYKTYRENRLPILKYIKTNAFIYRSSTLGSFKSYNYDKIRVASIGRTFLDMIRKPDLCGGINNVLKIFKNEAHSFINSIIDEIDLFGSKIEKVRAGYILENICGFNNEIVDSWEKYAMRGGSRKLDPLADYSPIYSERWKLSLNIKQ